MSSVVIGAERRIEAGVPVVPGGGFTDVMLRSQLKEVMNRVYYQILGPVILGEPGGDAPEGQVRLRFEDNLVEYPVGTLRTVPGGTIHGRNNDNDEEKTVDTLEDGGFLLGVAADVGHSITLTSFDPAGNEVGRIDLVAPLEGFGLDRNTPRFRRFVSLAQMTLESSDPINYALRWFVQVPPGWEPKNVLQLSAPGDMAVPINNQIALARAGGLLGDPRDGLAPVLERNDFLIERQVLLGFDRPFDPHRFPLYDPEDLDGNNCSAPTLEDRSFDCEGPDADHEYCWLCRVDEIDRPTPFPPVDTARGMAALRLPFGKEHAFHALPRSSPGDAPGYYAIYTRGSQAQMGAFLGSRGLEWQDGWDCRIERTEIPDPEDPSRTILITDFEDGCPF